VRLGASPLAALQSSQRRQPKSRPLGQLLPAEPSPRTQTPQPSAEGDRAVRQLRVAGAVFSHARHCSKAAHPVPCEAATENESKRVVNDPETSCE
jgi:hypothetical protein